MARLASGSGSWPATEGLSFSSRQRRALATAFGISGLAFLLAGVLALALPETRGRILT